MSRACSFCGSDLEDETTEPQTFGESLYELANVLAEHSWGNREIHDLVTMVDGQPGRMAQPREMRAAWIAALVHLYRWADKLEPAWNSY